MMGARNRVSSHIDGDHDGRDASIEEQFAACDLNLNQAAVFLPVFPVFTVSRPSSALAPVSLRPFATGERGERLKLKAKG